MSEGNVPRNSIFSLCSFIILVVRVHRHTTEVACFERTHARITLLRVACVGTAGSLQTEEGDWLLSGCGNTAYIEERKKSTRACVRAYVGCRDGWCIARAHEIRARETELGSLALPVCLSLVGADQLAPCATTQGACAYAGGW